MTAILFPFNTNMSSPPPPVQVIIVETSTGYHHSIDYTTTDWIVTWVFVAIFGVFVVTLGVWSILSPDTYYTERIVYRDRPHVKTKTRHQHLREEDDTSD